MLLVQGPDHTLRSERERERENFKASVNILWHTPQNGCECFKIKH